MCKEKDTCPELREKMNTTKIITDFMKDTRNMANKYFVLFLITLVMLFATNAAWLYEWTQYDYVSVDSQGGSANYIGRDGDITNGSSESPSEKGRK
jgi:hypothetical protein